MFCDLRMSVYHGFFILFIYSVFTIVSSGDANCIDFTKQTNTVQFDCKFNESSGDNLECDTLERARDYTPFYSFPFYVHTRYTFQVSQYVENGPSNNVNDTDSSTIEGVWRCLYLRRSVQRRITLDEPWKNVTLKYLEPFYMYLLISVKDMTWDTQYTSEDAVGYVHLNKTCWEANTDFNSCINEVRALNIVTNTGERKNYYLPEHWDDLRRNRLQVLQLSDSRLTFKFDPSYDVSIPVYVSPFVNGTGLYELTITGSHFGNMEHFLKDQPKLLVLVLSNNNIVTIHPDNFKSAPNVENLIISHNNLTSVPEGIKYLNNLNVFDMSGNPLLLETEDQIDNFTTSLQKNKNIKSIDLSHIPLRSMHPLRQLLGSANSNRSSSLKLHYLRLSNCGIVSLGDEDTRDIFDQQIFLQGLLLSGNKFTTVPSDLFAGLVHLRYLNLANVGFNERVQLTLSTDSLQIVDFSRNNFTKADDILIAGKVPLLDLSHNQISKWNTTDAFICTDNIACPVKVSWVNHLDLSNNKITGVTSEMANSFRHMHSVDLGGNFIDCQSCDIPILKKLLQNIERNELPFIILNAGNKTDITCFTPIDYTETPVKAVPFNPETCHRDF